MAKKSPIQAQISRLNAIRHFPDADAARQLLLSTLEQSPGMAVAKATEIIANHACGGPPPEDGGDDRVVNEEWVADFLQPLADAFNRLCENPEKTDKGAFGKIALVASLDRLEYQKSAPFERGATLRQFEPEMGGQVDKAPPIRACSICALVRLRHPERYRLMTDMLWDMWQDARLGAVRAAAYDGSDTGEMLLRAKAIAGDRGSDVREMAFDGGAEVLGEVYTRLLSMNATANAPFVARYLESKETHAAVREQAALALGESRSAEGLRLLRESLEAAVHPEERERAITGLAVNATDEALEIIAARYAEAGAGERRMIEEIADVMWGENSGRFARIKQLAQGRD